MSSNTLIDRPPGSDNWVHDQALLDRPGNADIQMDIFYDYRTNLPLYPAVQAYFRQHLPPALIVWGKNDTIFPADGAPPTSAICRRSSSTFSTRVTSYSRTKLMRSSR